MDCGRIIEDGRKIDFSFMSLMPYFRTVFHNIYYFIEPSSAVRSHISVRLQREEVSHTDRIIDGSWEGDRRLVRPTEMYRQNRGIDSRELCPGAMDFLKNRYYRINVLFLKAICQWPYDTSMWQRLLVIVFQGHICSLIITQVFNIHFVFLIFQKSANGHHVTLLARSENVFVETIEKFF